MSIEKTFRNKDGLLSFVWAMIQQLVVAASTYCIIEAIRHTTAGDYITSLRYVFVFVACLILVYIPNTISLVYLQKWRLSSFSQFVHWFAKSNHGRTTWAHSRDKMQYESWLTNESAVIYDNATNLIYQLYSTLFSTILNVLVISLAMDYRIMGWYVLAGILLYALSRSFHKKITDTSVHAQNSRKNLSNVMLAGWDNIFVGNKHNLEHWFKKFTKKLEEAKTSAVSYDITRSIVSSVTVSLALLVLAFGNGVYYFENRTNMAAIAVLFITLPRQLQIVQNIFTFFNIFLSWEGTKQQLKQLETTVHLSTTQKNLSSHIQFANLTFSIEGSQKKYGTLHEMSKDILRKKPGRITIRGSNGTGKSTILAALSELTGEDSFYLPSNYVDLAFTKENLMEQSDGSRVLSIFDEVSHLKSLSYILLDEWDANLDSENLQKIDAKIEHLAQNLVVIESRHRESNA